MPFNFSQIAKNLFHRYTRKSATPAPNRARLGVTLLEDRVNPTPVVTITATGNLTEGGSGSFQVTRSDTTGTLSVNFSLTGTATNGSDYNATSSPVFFPSGMATVGIFLANTDDSTAEPTETVIATLTSGSGYTVGTPNSATINILDNDTPVVTVAKVADGVEGVSNGTFRFTRSITTSSPLTVNYWVDGTAISGTDYTALSGSVTFSPYSATADLTIAVLNDSIAESDESVTLTLDGGTGYEVGIDNDATVTIADTETPVVSVVKNRDALEGDWNGDFWFVRLGDKRQQLTVNYALTGTATSGTDYTSIGTSVTFAAENAVAVKEIDASDDGTSDPNETVILTLQTGTGYQLGLEYSATVTIIDSGTPFVTVEKIDDGVEGGTNGTFRFTRTGSTSSALTVYYAVGGDATSGTDYTALPGSVTIAASSATADVTVTVTNDSVDEPNEFVTVAISTNSGYAIGDSGSAVVVIDDNDLPEVTVTKIVDAAETGGYGIFRFARALGELDQGLTVSYSVGGTATPGTDYNSLSGSVTFAANEATKDVVITPNTDGSGEGTETVSVSISSNAAYTIGTASSASLDLREEAPGGVSGKMWIDEDGDGEEDSGEEGFEGVDVFLMKSGEVVARATTSANGSYAFTGVAAATYTVLLGPPEGFTPTVTEDGQHPVTVTPGTTSTDVSEGCQPPTPAPANTPDPAAGVPGIKWSTLTKGPALTVEGVEGHKYTVQVQRGGTLTPITIELFMANPAATQPAPIRAAGFFINHNCHGYTMDLSIVKDGQTLHFALIDPTSATLAWLNLYKPVSAKEAKEALANGTTVTAVWSSGLARLHSVKVTQIVLKADDSLDEEKSKCDSKTSWKQVEQNVSIKSLSDAWANPPAGTPAAIGPPQLYVKK